MSPLANRCIRRPALLVAMAMLVTLAIAVPGQAMQQAPDGWRASLSRAVGQIDAQMPGELGVYVRRLGDADGAYAREAEKRWYLSSTVKIPVAIAVLEMADQGRLSLDEQLTLKRSDFVDGSGSLLWEKPGTRHSIARLLARSIEDSDSTATDMLIRRIGEEHLNARLRAWAGGGFGRITTILQVRYDVYGALHPGVARLDNMQIVALRAADAGEPRLKELARALGVPRSALGNVSFEQAFENYYRRGLNSGTLSAFGSLLERLVAGELLGQQGTQRLLDHMRRINTGDRRIRAGLPQDADFVQKTGTQVRRACNVGTIDPRRGASGAVVVVACAERFDALAEAEHAFSQLGTALVQAGVLRPGAAADSPGASQ